MSRGDVRFPRVRVSSTSHELVQALETACVSLGASDATEDILDAFGSVSLAREQLYRRIQDLEARCREATNVILGF